LAGETEWLLETGNPLHAELYAKMQSQLLRPRVIVDYKRRAFVYPPGNGIANITSYLHRSTGERYSLERNEKR
ncbi:MAG: hypothetical protein PUK79_09675, partial [Clostridiales bacterium]|nr:hypothetical protein [Clostridiales bacterium]